MAPDYTINTSKENFERLIKVADTFGMDYLIPNKNITILPSKKDSKYLEVPSIGLAVPKERSLFNHNFYETQEALDKENSKMLKPNEFREFLKVAREKDRNLYNEITQVCSPGGSEWLDVNFKYENGEMFVDYHVFDENGNIQKKKEKLDKDTLMNDRTPGISIESWLKESTSQGLPKNSNLEGNLYYWAPDKDNNSVARFVVGNCKAGLDAYWNPSVWDPYLGVRAAKQLK